APDSPQIQSRTLFDVALFLQIEEISVRLFSIHEEIGAPNYAYSLSLSDSSFLVTNKNESEIAMNVETKTISFANIDGQNLFARSEVPKEDRSMIAISFTSIYDSLIDMKENSIVLTLNNCRLTLIEGLIRSAAKDLLSFTSEPAGMIPIEIVEAVTKLSVIFGDLGIDYRPVFRGFRTWLGAQRCKISMNLIPHSPTFGADVTVNGLQVHLLKNAVAIGYEIDESTLMIERGVLAYLTQCGYANIASCDAFQFNLRLTKAIGSESNRVEMDISNGLAYLDCCPDSYKLLLEIAEYIGGGGDSQYATDTESNTKPEKKPTEDIRTVPDLEHDILNNVDEVAFAKSKLPQIPRFPDFKENELAPGDDFDGAIAITTKKSESQQPERIIIHDNSPFYIEEDYFSLTGTPGYRNRKRDIDNESVPEQTLPMVQISVNDINLSLRMFDGFDFPIRDFPDDDSESMSTTLSHDPEYFDQDTSDDGGSPSSSQSRTLKRRSASPRIQTNFSHIRVTFKTFPEKCVCASDLHLTVGLLEIIDNLTTSAYRKFLTVMKSDGGNSDSSDARKNMIDVGIVRVRPNVDNPESQEIRVAPLRFFVDQDALFFIGYFFTYGIIPSPVVEPIISLSDKNEKEKNEIFYQLCSILPIPVKIDYKPKHINFTSLRDGNLLEIFNFLPMEGSEMNLNQVRLNGINGTDKLVTLIKMQWLKDVTSNQSHRVVKGLSGIKPIANIGAGIADLILLPWQQYQQEGKVMRGLEKGVKSFTKSAAIETLALGTKIAITTQAILETVENTASGSRRVSIGGDSIDQNRSRLSEQPRNISEGMQQGAQSFARNVNEAVKTVLDAPARSLQTDGGSAAVAFAKAVPSAILKPMIGATEAVSKTLLGMQNSIDSKKKSEITDKYKE
ncbi:autophagy- protein 2, partial [Physocladia obscura]